MKKLIFLLVFVIYPALSQDLILPDTIDCGEFNIRYFNFETDHPKYLYNGVKTFDHQGINNSGEIIYMYRTKISYDYDADIIEKGNELISFRIGPGCAFPGDTLIVSGAFIAHYMDDYSKRDEYLTGKVITYYRKRNSLELDSIETVFKFKAVDKKEIFILDKMEHRARVYPHYFEKQRNGRVYRKLFNATDKDFIIDSVDYEFEGENIQSLEFSYIDTSITSFPYELKSNKFLGLNLKYKTIEPDTNYCRFAFHGHYEGEEEKVEYRDTFSVVLNVIDDLYISNYHSPFGGTIYFFENDEIKFDRIRALNFTKKEWNLKDIEYEVIEGEKTFEFNPDFDFPLNFQPNENKFIEQFSYTIEEKGIKKLWIKLNFENNDGETLYHTVVYKFNADFYTSVDDGLDANENLKLYPNPSRDILKIQLPEEMAFENQIEVYNSGGELMFRDIFNNDFYSLNTIKFSSGMYFVVISNDLGIMKDHFVIIK